ncbi:hypothetical protein [Lacunimicrobium album]
MAKHHPNKDINAAIEYALERGWRFEKAGARAHVFGRLLCPVKSRGACLRFVFSTPKNPHHHAQWIRDRVDECDCQSGEQT